MKQPTLIKSQAQIDAYPPFPFPNLSGKPTPEGWKEVGKPLFVDSSGCGRPGEPALTQDQFKASLEVGKAYAVVDVGQFQLQVGVFERSQP